MGEECGCAQSQPIARAPTTEAATHFLLPYVRSETIGEEMSKTRSPILSLLGSCKKIEVTGLSEREHSLVEVRAMSAPDCQLIL